MKPQQTRQSALWLTAFLILVILLTGCVALDGVDATGVQATADVLQTFAGDFLRQLLQAVVL